ncbi:RTTN [Lepeophtheirus salmonis]|uniref:RTTN n=1 Tax=Lepeophtheirus salmonis TaxID=72036 RepID=A0A7R8H2E4_LEPSM|nr:RTTN [Lepeophtheirus salmonis]CAF2812355.1 RTTN [Lepeophtheirus salmonis]
MTFPPIDSSVPEIRLRALSSIHSKLDKGLLSAADLLKDNFLARFVDFWFIRKDVLQGSKTALLLLRNILSFTEVQNACMDLGVRKILSQWRLHVGEKVLQNLVWEILEEKLPIPLRAANEADLISAIQFNSNSPEVISTTTSSSISSPRVLPMKSLPLRLLLPPSKADALEEPSTYSPVRQHYFKKVQFSQLDNSLTESEPTFPWISLSSIDLEHLRPHTDIAHHPDQMRELCQTFCSSLLIDFPPEVFLQRPDLIKTLIQVLDVTENISLKSHICESLNVYIHKLVNKLELSREFHSKAMSNLDHSCYYDEDDSMSDSKNNSIEDRLQAVTLKKECLSTVEFVWITFEASLSLWVLNDGDHSYRLLNSVYTLEIQLIKLLEFLNVDIHKKRWWKDKRNFKNNLKYLYVS